MESMKPASVLALNYKFRLTYDALRVYNSVKEIRMELQILNVTQL